MSMYEIEQLKQQAEELFEPLRADARELTAILLTIRSELDGNGVAHSSADLVELTKMVVAKHWRIGWYR